jgi:hypothetical protein
MGDGSAIGAKMMGLFVSRPGCQGRLHEFIAFPQKADCIPHLVIVDVSTGHEARS